MSKRRANQKNNKNQPSKGNKGKNPKRTNQSSRNEHSDYPWQVRFLFFPLVLAVAAFLAYFALKSDTPILEFLSSLLTQFSTSPVKIIGEVLNIVFGLVVFLLWALSLIHI